MIYENDNYIVMVNEEVSGYNIINKMTNVIEGESKMKPEAINLAMILNGALEQLEENPEVESIDKSNIVKLN